MNAGDVTHAKGLLKGEQLKFKFWRWIREQIEIRGRNQHIVSQWHIIVISIEEVEALQTLVNANPSSSPEEDHMKRLANSVIDKLYREYQIGRRW